MINRAQLRATGAFTEYPDSELEMLVGAAIERSYTAGQDLCREGAVGTACYCIVLGVVDVIKRLPQGESSIATLQAGSIAGQLALIQNVPRTATLRARTDTVVLQLSRDTFERLLSACSPLALRFQRQIATAGIRQLRSTLKRAATVLAAHDPEPVLQKTSSRAPPSSSRPPETSSPSTATQRAEQLSTVDALEFIQSAARDWDVSLEALDGMEFKIEPRTPTKRPSVTRP
jgi:CRP/FNR family transcriptional regulator, cyclic AMP receptor protein